MPVLDGFCAQQPFTDIAILTYSIPQSEEFRNESRQIGFDGHVPKSDGLWAMLNAIDEVQRRRSQPTQTESR
jgi:hypothetical protein